MSLLSSIRTVLNFVFCRRSAEREMEQELRSHLRGRADDLERQGLSRAEAERQARIEFGGYQRYKEECREALGTRLLGELLADLRYGVRQLRRKPGFTAVAVITLALGIGANSAIFTLAYAVILKSLPVPDPGQLVRYTFRNGTRELSLSGPSWTALEHHESVDAGILAWAQNDFTVKEYGMARSVTGALMSGNGFRVLELQPYIGQVFGERDDMAGGGPHGYQAVLGYGYWERYFHRSERVLGQVLNVDGRAVTIIGVLPRGFDGLIANQRTDLILPLSFDGQKILHQPGEFWLTVIGRLRPGETLQAAEANLRATLTAVRNEADPTHLFLHGFFAPFKFGVESGRAGRSVLKVTYERPLLALEILVGLLLLLCCANTALLVVAHVGSRHHEFGVRRALGAPRGRLLRQVMMEVALLAACGLGLAIVLGWAGAGALLALFAPVGQPPPLDIAPRAAILAFCTGITVLAALAAGFWPAWRASRIDASPELKQASAGAATGKMGRWIVPATVAMSTSLLLSAWLLGGVFFRLLIRNSGFRTNGVTIADVDLSANKLSSTQTTRDAVRIADLLDHTPGVEAVTAMSAPPIDGWYIVSHRFSLGPHGTVHTDLQTWPESVSPKYFAVMGTQILEGRSFTRADQNGSRVCILSDSAARYFFPGEEPIGKYVYPGGSNPSLDGEGKLDMKSACRVVGVAQNARFRSLRAVPPQMIYEPLGTDTLGSEFFVAVRSRSAGLGAAALRDAVRRVIPTAVQPDVFTFNQLVDQNLRTERLLTALSLLFAGVALLLTGLGLYGLLSRNVVQRTREIGLRMALGARPSDVLMLVIRQGVLLAFIGTAVGLMGATAFARILRGLILGVQAPGLLAFTTVVLIIFGVALVASYIPARRATKVDPMVALRHE